jgi:chromosome segregation ATPase
MSSELITLLTALLAFLGGGGGKWILDLFRQNVDDKLKSQKQESELRLGELEKAFTIYKDIADSLKKDIIGLNESSHILEKERLELISKYASQTVEIKYKDEQIQLLKDQIQELKESQKKLDSSL